MVAEGLDRGFKFARVGASVLSDYQTFTQIPHKNQPLWTRHCKHVYFSMYLVSTPCHVIVPF